MAVKMIRKSVRPQVNILASNHKTSFAVKLPRDSELAKEFIVYDENLTHKIVLAGTIYPQNDGTAKGIILNDYDVTYGDANVAVLTHGVVKACMLPEDVTAEAKAALKHIQFQEPMIDTVEPSLVCPKPDKVQLNTEVENSAVLVLNNASFLPLAEVKDNWGFAVPAESTGEILDIKLVTEKLITIRIKGTIKAAGDITLSPDPKITTAKKVIPAVKIAEAITTNKKGDK